MERFGQIKRLAEQGDLGKVDLMIRDISPDPAATLDPTLTAANFGNLSEDAAAADLGSAVYQLYRHLYRASGANEAYFALDPAAWGLGLADADRKLSEARFAAALRDLKAQKAPFPDLSSQAINAAYPGRCQSLTQVLSTTDSRLTALARQPEK